MLCGLCCMKRHGFNSNSLTKESTMLYFALATLMLLSALHGLLFSLRTILASMSAVSKLSTSHPMLPMDFVGGCFSSNCSSVSILPSRILRRLSMSCFSTLAIMPTSPGSFMNPATSGSALPQLRSWTFALLPALPFCARSCEVPLASLLAQEEVSLQAQVGTRQSILCSRTTLGSNQRPFLVLGGKICSSPLTIR